MSKAFQNGNKGFQTNANKYKDTADIFNKQKSLLNKKEMNQAVKERTKRWITFYRRNIHRFIEHYFEVDLKDYQKIWIYEISQKKYHMTIASRGNAKSWLIALYAMSICTLYPGSKVVIVAKSMKQAGLIVSNKIQKDFQPKYPNIAREIKNIQSSHSDYRVDFHNTSYIKVVVGDEKARGERSTVNICEEFRLMKKEIIDSIISPFLEPRQPRYLSKKEYSHLKEETQRIYISSAGYKNEWIYREFKTVVSESYSSMISPIGFIAFDLKTTLYEGLKTKYDIEQDRKTFDSITFSIEYENLFFGESENAFFKLDMFSTNRLIKRAFYPYEFNHNPLVKGQVKNKYIKRKDGEIRIMGVDTATSPGKDNDNTAIACLRLLPTSEGYRRELVYMETHNGENSIIQALRIKQLYHNFECDYIILDMYQSGEGIYSQMGLVTYDEERGIEYDALTVMQHSEIKDSLYEELSKKTLAMNAKPVIFPVKADASFNDKAAYGLREKLKSGMFSLLVEDYKGETFLNSKNGEFAKSTDIYYKAWYLAPYVQISEFISECVSLEYDIIGGKVKMKEAHRRDRKDRYTAASYANVFAGFLDDKLLKQIDTGTDKWSDYVYVSGNDYSSNYY